jgi:hypothetical protein
MSTLSWRKAESCARMYLGHQSRVAPPYRVQNGRTCLRLPRSWMIFTPRTSPRRLPGRAASFCGILEGLPMARNNVLNIWLLFNSLLSDRTTSETPNFRVAGPLNHTFRGRDSSTHFSRPATNFPGTPKSCASYPPCHSSRTFSSNTRAKLYSFVNLLLACQSHSSLNHS